jgi:hypothetical protein
VAVRPLLELLGPQEIAVTSTEATAIGLWGASLSGWNDGSPPLLIEEAAVEEGRRTWRRGARGLPDEDPAAGDGDTAAGSSRTNEWRDAGGMFETTSSVLLPEQRRESDTSVEAALESMEELSQARDFRSGCSA